MAQGKKTKSVAKKKAAPKANSRFYVVKTAQQARENLTSRLEAYNHKFVSEPLESGKALVCDFKKKPRKTIIALLDDGKAYITNLNKDTRAKVDDIVKDGRSFLTKAGKNPRKVIRELVDDGEELVGDLQNDTRDRMSNVVDGYKSVMNGIGHDSRLIMDELLDSGKKAFDRVPGKKMVEKEINRRIKELPGLLNLPSPKEVDSLVHRINELNSKVTALSKATPGKAA